MLDEEEQFNYLPNIDDRIHRMNLRLGQTKPTSFVGNTIAQKQRDLLHMAATQPTVTGQGLHPPVQMLLPPYPQQMPIVSPSYVQAMSPQQPPLLLYTQ